MNLFMFFSCSVEELKASISKLNGKLRNFVNNLTKSGQQLQNMFASFIEVITGLDKRNF